MFDVGLELIACLLFWYNFIDDIIIPIYSSVIRHFRGEKNPAQNYSNPIIVSWKPRTSLSQIRLVHSVRTNIIYFFSRFDVLITKRRTYFMFTARYYLF